MEELLKYTRFLALILPPPLLLRQMLFLSQRLDTEIKCIFDFPIDLK